MQVDEIVIFDLDGTLALIEHRRHLISGENKNWDLFYERCIDDEPNKSIIDLCNMYFNDGKSIFILSGRMVTVRKQTLEWLDKHGVLFDSLYMRPKGDFTPDEELKEHWYEIIRARHPNTLIKTAVDDRNKVVKMWRAKGLTCLQVAEGNF